MGKMVPIRPRTLTYGVLTFTPSNMSSRDFSFKYECINNEKNMQ